MVVLMRRIDSMVVLGRALGMRRIDSMVVLKMVLARHTTPSRDKLESKDSACRTRNELTPEGVMQQEFQRERDPWLMVRQLLFDCILGSGNRPR